MDTSESRTFTSIGNDNVDDPCPMEYLKKKHLYRTPYRWTSEDRLIPNDWIQLRDSFWQEHFKENENLPNCMGGIWRLIHTVVCAFADKSYDLAQRLINRYPLYLPYGDLHKIMDFNGFIYTVPLYCLGFPENVGPEKALSCLTLREYDRIRNKLAFKLHRKEEFQYENPVHISQGFSAEEGLNEDFGFGFDYSN